MIKLEVEEYCNECPEFEPDVESESYHYNDDLKCQTIHYCKKTIRCTHAKRCKAMLRYLEKKAKEANDGKREEV